MKAVNLLPSDLKPSGRQAATTKIQPDTDRPYGAYGILAALALVVVGVAMLVLAGNAIKAREAELASAKIEQQTVAAEAAKLASYGEFASLATNRVATVRQLADSRFDWEQALRDLSRAVPANVTLKNITGTVAPGVSSGGASSSNALRGSIAKPAIELAGCTTDQRAVATLMARLRAVQGVTRVSLSKSVRAKSEDAAGGAADAKAEGCGLGSPAEFEIVMFFESATAAAATGEPGAAAAPAADPAATPAAGASPAAAGTPAAGASRPAAANSEGTTTR